MIGAIKWDTRSLDYSSYDQRFGAGGAQSLGFPALSSHTFEVNHRFGSI